MLAIYRSPCRRVFTESRRGRVADRPHLRNWNGTNIKRLLRIRLGGILAAAFHRHHRIAIIFSSSSNNMRAAATAADDRQQIRDKGIRLQQGNGA